MRHLPPFDLRRWLTYSLAIILLLTSCAPTEANSTSQPAPSLPTSVPVSMAQTPLPTRPSYKPGELVDYTAQDGDTLPALAARFNTTVKEIMTANPIIPSDATTMPPGLPMNIPIYYRALWGSPFRIIPDNAFVNGPTLVGFNTSAFVAAHDGWLKTYRTYAGGEWRTGAEVVDYIATNYSISPRLLLAILEYQGGALSLPEPPVKKNLLGLKQLYYDTPYLQLVVAANMLNNGYYGWRGGTLIEFDLPDGNLVRPDPWLNAASVSLQNYFGRIFSGDKYAEAIGPSGLLKTYTELFGDPWQVNFELIPGSLRQPDLLLPFPAGRIWAYTGGPHTGWGTGEPFAAVDFAPPSEFSGCFKVDKEQFATAVADGLVVRSGVDGLALDLDKDGDERTGWVIYYLHLARDGRAPAGQEVHAGDKIGYPSCEGGRVTGTHVHIARKYNGEWVLADSSLPFDMEGWIVHSDQVAYKGTLIRGGVVVTACECSDASTSVKAGLP